MLPLLDAQKDMYYKHTNKLKSIKTNWEKIDTNLKSKYSNFFSNDYKIMSPSEKYEYFIGTITDAIKDATPRKNYNRKQIKNPVPWWDSECNKIKRQTRFVQKMGIY